jgi:hypothetical protein
MAIGEKARQLAGEATATGSIHRIYAPVALTVDTYTFGKFVDGGDNVDYQTSTASIAVPAGSYLEGPFTQLHTSNHVSVVYYTGTLTVS